MSGIAIEAYLVDDSAPLVPSGFVILRSAFSEGVPRELLLSDGWSVILYVPTGTARTWLDASPDAIVTSSELERLAHDAAAGTPARAAPRLVARRGGAPLGALPLAAGVTGTFHAPSALLELMPVAWEVRAGAMRGAAPSIVRLELAWRSRVVPAGVVTVAGGAGGAGGASAAGASATTNLQLRGARLG